MRKLTFLLVVLSLLLVESVIAQQEQVLPEGVMATRGEGQVTRQIFDAKISRIPEKDRQGVLRSGERVERILADLLITSQLSADARAAGFDKGDIQYRMQLAAEGELANAWLDHYVESQPEADYEAMAREYYLINKDDLKSEPSVDVTHLLVSTKQQSKQDAEEIAQSILDQVTQDPALFDDLVLQRSEDPSVAANQGHFLGVKKGDMVRPFENAAFALENEGDFSGLVFTQYGYHIIRLDRINPVRQLTFDELEAQLIEKQRVSHKERLRNNYLSALGSQEWQVSEEELQAMVNRYFDQDDIKKDVNKAEEE